MTDEIRFSGHEGSFLCHIFRIAPFAANIHDTKYWVPYAEICDAGAEFADHAGEISP